MPPVHWMPVGTTVPRSFVLRGLTVGTARADLRYEDGTAADLVAEAIKAAEAIAGMAPLAARLANAYGPRRVVTLGMAVRRGLGGDVARQALQQAFDFLPVHRNPDTGGYAWLLDWRQGQARVLDGTNHAYGLAFVLLAHAHAHMAGI